MRIGMKAEMSAAVSDVRLGIFFRDGDQAKETEAAEALPGFWPMREFLHRPILIPENEASFRDDVMQTLDTAAALLRAGHWQHGFQLQYHAVAAARLAFATADWNAFAKGDCLAHPVCGYVHQDPFTRRSFQKPRGYAGDAVLLDYIYGIPHSEHEAQDATPLGRWICNYSSNTTAPRAVRHRMHLAAELIDRVCSERRGARILSLASGHGRELQISHAIRGGLADLVVAFDQDEASLAEVEATAISRNVRAVHGSIARLIAGRHDFSGFDLVYALGLFDYLGDRAARRLVEVMVDMLRPGGIIMVGNFLPDIYDAGYMESFMGWNLEFRSRAEIVALMDGVKSRVEDIRYFEESEGNIGFALAKRRTGRAWSEL
jgi:extracellular factor (EF) 3-hydroxypalmitic acid methyl ester biosynthesis protein